MDAGEHLFEVLLESGDILAVADDFEEILVTDKVEAREGRALPLQVLAQRLLDLAQQIRQPLQLPLHARDVEDVKNQWRLRHLNR